MSFEKLDEIIWRHVLDFLTPSLPKPLSDLCKSEGKDQSPPEIAELPDSGEPGVTSRSDIRAPELSVLMRVSPAFNRLAAVPLYKRVITDDLMRLVDMRGGQAAHLGIASKNELLFLTKSLHLEYGIKNSASHRAKEKTYEPIMNQQDAIWIGVGRTTFTASILLAALEVDSILRSSIDHPAEHPYSIRFPNLRTLTVGAIFGGQDGVWQSMDRLSWDAAAPRRWFHHAARMTSWQEAILAAKIAMITTFSRSPITRFCQRGSLGPLSLPTAFQWNDFETPDPPPTTPLFTHSTMTPTPP